MNPNQSQEVPRFSPASAALMLRMNRRMQSVLGAVEQTEFWRALTAPTVDPDLARSAMREVYLEILSYQRAALEGLNSPSILYTRISKVLDRLL